MCIHMYFDSTPPHPYSLSLSLSLFLSLSLSRQPSLKPSAEKAADERANLMKQEMGKQLMDAQKRLSAQEQQYEM